MNDSISCLEALRGLWGALWSADKEHSWSQWCYFLAKRSFIIGKSSVTFHRSGFIPNRSHKFILQLDSTNKNVFFLYLINLILAHLVPKPQQLWYCILIYKLSYLADIWSVQDLGTSWAGRWRRSFRQQQEPQIWGERGPVARCHVD